MTRYEERPWTKNYDPYVPASLAPYPEHGLHQFLTVTAQAKPNHTALITTVKLPLVGRQSANITYKELEDYANAFAVALVDMGLKKGDRVVIVMPNCTAFAISYYGILKAGGVVAATNPTYPAAKMQYQINDCDAEIVVCISMFYKLIKQVQPETKVKKIIVANIKDYMPPLAKRLFTWFREKKDGHFVEKPGIHDLFFQDLLKEYAGQKPNVDVRPDDLCIFQYTGGTTGMSKGAASSHRAMVTNSYQMQKWTGMADDKFTIPIDKILFLGAIPMFHSYGLLVMLTQAVVAGGSLVLIPNARDIDEVVDVIDYYKPNVFLGVPALYNAVNNHPRIKAGEVSLKSFLFNSSGSAPLPPATKQEFEQLSDSIIAEGFGMSELPAATHSNPIFGENRINSIGLPLPDVDACIVDVDDGDRLLPVGDVGELIISAPNMMRGYHNLPTETANTLQVHWGKTWLHTGDIAYMDEDGYFYIVDRKKDMALIGGFNVYPANVEKVIKDHPAVLEVGVAAIPHPKRIGEEALKAWIVLKPDAKVSEQEIVQHCEQYLAGYEVPRRISFIYELPKSAVGKTLRRELVQREMAELERQ